MLVLVLMVVLVMVLMVVLVVLVVLVVGMVVVATSDLAGFPSVFCHSWVPTRSASFW